MPFEGSVECVAFLLSECEFHVFNHKIVVFVGSGFVGTGESISEQCGAIGSAGHHKNFI